MSIQTSVLIKIELKIESRGKQNRDFELNAILGKVVISMLMLEIVNAITYWSAAV